MALARLKRVSTVSGLVLDFWSVFSIGFSELLSRCTPESQVFGQGLTALNRALSCWTKVEVTESVRFWIYGSQAQSCLPASLPGRRKQKSTDIM